MGADSMRLFGFTGPDIAAEGVHAGVEEQEERQQGIWWQPMWHLRSPAVRTVLLSSMERR